MKKNIVLKLKPWDMFFKHAFQTYQGKDICASLSKSNEWYF